MTLAVVTEGMHPAERERFVDAINERYDRDVDDDETVTTPAAAEFDEETWGTDPDAQARQAAAMSLFGGATSG